MLTSGVNPRILLIGAFERDNFGDLLFYQLTEKLMGGRGVAAGSVIGADMTSLLGAQVQPHNDHLSSRTWDVVWVVGGEVGGVTTENALAMSLTDVEAAVFDEVSTTGKSVLTRFLADSSLIDPAYLPVLSRFPLNDKTPLILNSVGLGNMAPPGTSAAADIAIAALRSASAVVVRDTASQDFALTAGVTTALSPDMVHAISILYPELAQDSGATRPPYFVFQANSAYIDRHGVAEIAQAIAALAAETGWQPVLLLAGVARHHDSPDQYALVLQQLHRNAPELNAVVLSTRVPLELASWIAQSQLWVGSSLHGRIVANSFSRPRVSLENSKVETYSRTWDQEFPSNVVLEDLGAAAGLAVSVAENQASREASAGLARAAFQATQGLVEEYL